jgi:4-alpha-glucanotransferase
MLKKRASGILLHISSLPSDFGVGDFGPQARTFADFLQKAGVHFWQILPLNMTMAKQGFSPYNCFSAFAGNPLFISPQQLFRDGLLTKQDTAEPPSFPAARADYAGCTRYKSRLFKTAFEHFRKRTDQSDYERFVLENEFWLGDFTLFMALKEKYGRAVWSAWPAGLKNRRPTALADARKRLRESIAYHRFLQYIFAKQYFSLKRYCNQRGIQIFGDLPIYVTYDSADVWAGPEWFKLTRSLKPRYIAGVPPDYFSKTGQLWGNPVYDWQRQARDGYSWWMRRMAHNFVLYDSVRIDHFRGFEAFWQIPAGHKTAIKGRWVKGPGEDFFRTLMNYFPQPPIIVEDLGAITPAVRELIGRFAFPVMKVLHFAFDGEFVKNTHLPHNHIENAVVYTGTHDNNTTRGWYRKDLPAGQKRNLTDYIGKEISQESIHQEMIRMAMGSVAKLAIIPMQDVLGLDEKSRMNNPAKTTNNWRWRMKPDLLKASLANDLRKLVEQYGRL